MFKNYKHLFLSLLSQSEESEKAIAKMKNLDETAPVPVKRKDVNTLQNNQVKITEGQASIPPENMKCNILKAKMEEHQKGFILHSVSIVVVLNSLKLR